MARSRGRTLAWVAAGLMAALVGLAVAQDGAGATPVGRTVTALNLAESSDLGRYLADQDGMALYAFLPDAQGPSTCYGDCATNWPPVLVESAEVRPDLAEGIDHALVGTVERDDGGVQLTYAGWPLYYYLGDMEAGVTQGQGLGGNWFVVDAAGTPVGAP